LAMRFRIDATKQSLSSVISKIISENMEKRLQLKSLISIQ